jgi:type II secretory pathway component PulK
LIRAIAHITKRTIDALDRPARSPFERDRHPRGVALLISLITITLLAASVVEFAYSNRVNLALASNERDKLKSYFLAKSAVNLSRLLLSFQFALQDESRQTDDDMGRLIGRAMRRSNFQMHQYIDLLMGPFNSGKIESPIGGINLRDTGVEGFGDFTGEMEVQVIPEDGRLNLNAFARPRIDETELRAFCAMILDAQYDPIFEQEDPATGETLDRALVMQRIIDHIDPDEEGTLVGPDCTIQGRSGDETRPYRALEDDDGMRVQPRNAKLTHVAELNQVPGITPAFMRAFSQQFTVYPVGKPNINVAQAPVFYAILCQHVMIEGQTAQTPLDLCSSSPAIGMQVFFFALALDGVRTFFESPLSVLLAYVGTTESKLLPSAKKGQPVAFLSVSQLPAYLEDFRISPQLMAQFIQYSPLYAQMSMQNPQFAIDPLAPQFPPWTISFNRSGLMRSVSTTTPQIYRIYATGRYGSTETTVETVVDFGKTVRRIPSEAALESQESEPEALRQLKEQRKATLQVMPKGRYLYWREE